MKTPFAFRYYLFLALFLFASAIATAQREAPKAVDIKGASAASAAKVFNPKGTPAKIKDTYGIWTDFNLRTKADADKLRTQIGSTLFEEIAKNCNETSGWPGAISSYTERNKVRDQMLKYVCYQIAEIDDKWILRVPATENSFLPYGVRPDHDIFFMVRKTDVELNGAPSNTAAGSNSYSSSSSTTSSYTPVSNLKGPRAKIKDSFGIWTDFVLTTKADAPKVKDKLGYTLYNDVAENCNETKWPSGISSYTMREKVRPEILKYVCYQIGESDDKWILRVPAAENSFQPYNMRPTRDIYFMVRKTDVELSGSPINTLTTYTSTSTPSSTSTTTTSSYYNKAYPAKINSTGGMYYTFSLLTETKAAYLKGYWGTTDFENAAKYCREENWPSGISSLSARDKVRSQINNYKAYRIAEFDGKSILKIPADENKFMPYDMRPTRDIFFVINSTDVTVTDGKSSSASTTTATTTAKTSSDLQYSKDDIDKKVKIAYGSTIYSDLADYDIYEDVKTQLDATEYSNALEYSKSENWPAGIATKAARDSNKSKISEYNAVIAGYFWDDYDMGLYLLKLTPKANATMPAELKPSNTIYLMVDEYDVDLE